MLAVNQALAEVIKQTIPVKLVQANQEQQKIIDYQTKILKEFGAPQCFNCFKFFSKQDIDQCIKCRSPICHKCWILTNCQACGGIYCKHCYTNECTICGPVCPCENVDECAGCQNYYCDRHYYKKYNGFFCQVDHGQK